MLGFLKEYNVSDITIKKIERENAYANVYNLSCNVDEVGKIINYFRNLGIKCINDLLIYRIEIFFKSYDDILKCFSKYNCDLLVEKLNEDFTIMDEIN